jgi:hypothetical protein
VAWNERAIWSLGQVSHACKIRPVRRPHTCELTSPNSPSDATGEAPRYLQITAKMVRLKIIKTSQQHHASPSVHGDINRTFLAFLFNDDLDIILHKPYLDTPLSYLQSDSEVFGVLFDESMQTGPHPKDPVVLLVKPRGNFYERIGIFGLSSYIAHDWVDFFLHVRRSLRFYERSTGAFLHQDTGYTSGQNAIPLWKDREWEKQFVEDTIVLG